MLNRLVLTLLALVVTVVISFGFSSLNAADSYGAIAFSPKMELTATLLTIKVNMMQKIKP